MKQDLLQEIETQLSSLGIHAEKGGKTDLSIDVELLDASFSTGKKKLKYESMILLDEEKKTVRMYEKTTELSVGVSFGASAETSSSSPCTSGRGSTGSRGSSRRTASGPSPPTTSRAGSSTSSPRCAGRGGRTGCRRGSCCARRTSPPAP